MMACISVEICGRFGGKFSLIGGDMSLQKSVNINQTTERHGPEDDNTLRQFLQLLQLRKGELHVLGI